jgi:hypothetical protein
MSRYKNIKALGFVEVIIAIVVVGVASAVFLTMSGRAMRELVQNERIESMRRVAKNGVEIAVEAANLQKGAKVDESYFPMDSTDEGRCFIPVKGGSGAEVSYGFLMDGSDEFLSMSDAIPDDTRVWALEGGRAKYESLYLADSPEEEDEYLPTDYFLLMCIDSFDPTGEQWADVYFWVGDIHVDGKITSDSDLKDFKYNAIIDL